MNYRISSDKLIIFGYFLSVIALGTGMLTLPWAWGGAGRLGMLNALFTATSAVCVTGLIVVDTAQFTLFGQTVIVMLIQFGGLGIVTFATLFVALPRRTVSLVNRGIIKEMYIDEVEKNPRFIIRTIILSTLVIELIGYLFMSARFRQLGIEGYRFSAAFHAVSAFCNAGFSTFSDGLNGFVNDYLVTTVVMGLVVTGGIGFVVMQDLGKVFMRRKRRLSYHTKVALGMTTLLIACGAVAFYAIEAERAYAGFSVPKKIMAALFQSVTPRTAGFDTVSQSLLSLPSVAFVIFLMFVGGAPGSTAGGVKTTTIFMAFASAFKGHEDDGSISFNGGVLAASSVVRAFSVLAKAVFIIGMAFVGMLLAEGDALGFVDLLFETVSAFGTVGLSRGITAQLGVAAKLILIATMFVGRVGLFAMALSRSLDRVERFAEYPRENLLLG